MKAVIKDANMLKTLDPKKIATYLKGNGWILEHENSQQESIWTFKDESQEEIEILLPLNQRFKDFPYRISEIIKTLEFIENRSQLDIFKDLNYSFADVIQIRVNNPEIINGTIPIYEGVRLLESAKTLMYSAASTVINPMPYFRGIFKDVKYFMNDLRIGQTEPGSYIINIISPLEHSGENISNSLSYSKNDINNFQRNVSKKLFTALSNLSNLTLIDVDNDDLLLEQAQNLGISANLCDAILSIGGFIDEQGIDFNLRWSKLIEFPENIPSQVILPTQSLDSIGEVKEKLKKYKKFPYSAKKIKTEPSEEGKNLLQPPLEKLRLLDTVKGLVAKLEWLGGNDIPKVTLINLEEKDSKPEIIVELDSSNYFKAITANLSQRPIRCYGKLIKEDTSWVLKETAKLLILSDSDNE